MSLPSSSTVPVNRHAPTAVERQRSQLDRLLKDPSKPAYVPPPPKEKSIRPPREMMKNVQGSSAGAGSGEFHVYKASRRREYERLKLLDEIAQKEADAAEFERKTLEAEQQAESKTAKNRAKRLKKKEKTRGKLTSDNGIGSRVVDGGVGAGEVPIKKRRLVNGKELVFKRPGEDSGGEDDCFDREDDRVEDGFEIPENAGILSAVEVPQVLGISRLVFHED